MADVSGRLREQYQEIAEIIEVEGMIYAIRNLEATTDDKVLNDAIRQAQKYINEVERILEPYLF